MDYGTSYFEGALVEKEYDKKVKGKPNIYDRLKCRTIDARGAYGRQYSNADMAVSTNLIKKIFFLYMAKITLIRT